MLEPEVIEQIARRVGATVHRERQDERGEWIIRAELPSHDAKLRMLSAIATASAEDYEVITLARRIVRDEHARTEAQRAVAIHRWVQQNVHHCFEPVETFPDAMTVARLGIGDCDDAALLVMALCLAIGLTAGLQAFGEPPEHVCAAVKLGDRWWPLETTIDAAPGENPYDAAQRLGEERKDLLG
jgi:transglutaminase-like putative cysteine protease